MSNPESAAQPPPDPQSAYGQQPYPPAGGYPPDAGAYPQSAYPPGYGPEAYPPGEAAPPPPAGYPPQGPYPYPPGQYPPAPAPGQGGYPPAGYGAYPPGAPPQQPVQQQQMGPRKTTIKMRKETSHLFHLVMSILTLGLWAVLVWFPIIIWHSVGPRKKLTERHHY